MPVYKNSNNALSMTWGAISMKDVTPDDSTDLVDGLTRGVYVGGFGDLSVITAEGDEIILKNLAQGVIHPLFVGRIKATGTTATDIVAIY